MPEGPSIVILKEAAEQFADHKVIAVTGNAKIDKQIFVNKKVLAVKTYGKHFLICFKDATIRIHLLMFGTYLINETKSTPLRLGLKFNNGDLNFYTCDVKVLDGDINDHYDWTTDIMNKDWNAKHARDKLKAIPYAMICDALANQDIFAGLGNIIKNEVLYRVKVQPESMVGKIPAPKIKRLVDESSNYSFEFLKWKKQNVLSKHWLAHEKKVCTRCNLPLEKKHTGKNKRRSFFCVNCQILYK